MRMTAITDKSGKVISTYIHPEQPGKDDPTVKIHGGPGHTSHEIEVPAEYASIESIDELHRRVADHLA